MFPFYLVIFWASLSSAAAQTREEDHSICPQIIAAVYPTQSHKSHFPNAAREKRAQKQRKAKATFQEQEVDLPNLKSPSFFTTPGWDVGRLP